MRKIIILLVIAAAFVWSCEDMYDNQKKYEGKLFTLPNMIPLSGILVSKGLK